MAGLVQLDWSEADGLDSWPRLGVNRNALLDRVQPRLGASINRHRFVKIFADSYNRLPMKLRLEV